VPVRYFSLLRDIVRRQGVDTAQWLRMAGVDEARFEQRDATLLPLEVEGLVASARRLTGRSDLAFEMGRQIKMNSHDLLGYGMLSCRTVDEVMRLVVRHYHLMTETFTLRYQRTPGGRGEAVYTPTFAMPLEMLRFYYEVLAMAHQNQIALIFGGPTPAYDFHLAMPEPAHAARYLSLAPLRFHFDEPALPGIRVVMGADLLDQPLPMANARVVEDVDERCSALGQRPQADDASWGDYVTMMLREAHGELITLDDLARRVNVSARTIDRHLKKENLQFRDLSQQVRFERACELLTTPGATVAQVALSLGFSDAANFSRAFRRVVGVSPSEYQLRPNEASLHRA
jgi:AraC-like DNA-binding protein